MDKGDRVYQDLKDQLFSDSNPVLWEQPRLGWSKEVFRKHRHVFCPYYKRCMNYAAGLHWAGWSCNWCEHNPHRFEKMEYRKVKGKEGSASKPRKMKKKRELKPIPRFGKNLIEAEKRKKKFGEKQLKALNKALNDLGRGVK